MQTKKRKSPSLRFRGYTDDWEERKLTDIVSRLSKTSHNSELPKVEFEDIVAGEGRLNKDVSHKFDDRKGILFESQNILYGKLRPYLKNWLLADFKGIALGDFWVFQSINSDPKFVYSLIQSNHYQKVANDTSGTKMPRSDWKKVSSTVFTIPNYEEQKQIGAFFKQLDNTIALHQRKLDLLKEQKKGFLQKMFPKNGARVPELRFENFTDDWEERKLGELALVLTGFPFKNEDFVDNGKYLVITNGNIQNESSTVDVSLGNRVDDLSDEIKERYYLNKNDILVTMDGTVGRTAKVVDDNLILAQRVARLVANKNTEFVYQWLNQGSFFNEMTKVSHGGTIKHISLNEISNYSATVPSNNIEQQKIGSFFKQLDDTIALHQRKLDLLKEQKKGFLQKMFI
ncbi:restriction endonuclease subunit S [Leuconostoc citreum]|uniref:restriction endonuclease subunit S n=1 Tax=Leuconostoc citreum TaxID=33964 RepID=UPI0011BB220D|nr:restriction endonuclease subunit S [Leuconostoc citreum]QEA46422.1 restriction endonuclease subunit S [Leuconostoc citreum]QEA63112.1 restriction endonuclease subunit S [Leuconostoc citreum]